MTGTPAFPVLLELIEGRSAALRDAALRGSLTAAVPGCPGWSLSDLLAHLGEVQRFWAAVVTAGPAQSPPDEDVIADREPTGDLMSWSAASTHVLLSALREAGPQRGCWTWWSASTAPETCRSVARHQVQEAAVHAWDAQEAIGYLAPLPPAVAVDGVGEFLTVGLGALGHWPHGPAELVLSSDEGMTWLLKLSHEGAAAARQAAGWQAASADPSAETAGPATATVRGSASDLVLFLYGRDTGGRIKLDGQQVVIEELLAWADTA